MRISKLELRVMKRSFTPANKTRCKKLEQQGGNMNIVYEGKDYTLVYDKAREVITLNANNTGIMHKGNNVRSMDKWNKINYEENKVIDQIDRLN